MDLEKKFLDALFGEDELGVVIRAHIHIEARVYTLLESLIPFPGKLPKLRFDQVLNLVCALGLRDTFIGGIKELGNIRNRFGHQLDTKLTAGRVENILDNMSEEDSEILLRGYEMGEIAEINSPFESLNPKSKFIIVCVGLDSLLCQAIKEAEGN